MKSLIFINSQSLRKAAILFRKAGVIGPNPNEPMEFLGFLVIGFLIAILVLPFVALVKANRAKRGVDDLVKRLSSLESELRNLQPQTVSAVQPEGPVAAPEPGVEAVPTLVPAMPAAPAISKAMPEPPPIPQLLQTEHAANRHSIHTADRLGTIHGRQIVRVDEQAGIFPRHRIFREMLRFEHNLIAPELRIAIGFIVGAAQVLLLHILKTERKRRHCADALRDRHPGALRRNLHAELTITSHSLGLIPTFLLMTLITAVAFLLFRAVERYHRRGARDRRWISRARFATQRPRTIRSRLRLHRAARYRSARAGATATLECAADPRWNRTDAIHLVERVLPGGCFTSNKTIIFMVVFIGFQALFLAAAAWAKRTGKENTTLFASAIGLAAVAMFSAFYLLVSRQSRIGRRCCSLIVSSSTLACWH